MAFEHVLDALQLQCLPGEPVVPDQLQLNVNQRSSEGSGLGWRHGWRALMRPAFAPAATSLGIRKLWSHLCTLRNTSS
jgi:hypothetical protein